MMASTEFYDLMNEFSDGKTVERQEKHAPLTDAHFKHFDPMSYSQQPQPPQQFQHGDQPALNYSQIPTIENYYDPQYTQPSEQDDMDVSISIREGRYK